MDVNNIVPLVSLALALFAFLYSLFTNTKPFELRSTIRRELLQWYSDTIGVVQQLYVAEKMRSNDVDLHTRNLARLSAQIEIGRFHFPNIETKDSEASRKPPAYGGRRNLVLDLLVFYYRLFERDDRAAHLRHAETIERHFTSQVWEILNPRHHLRDSARVTRKQFSKELTFEDFLDKEPEIILEYL